MGCSHTRAKVRLADERIEGFSPHRELSLFIPKSLHHFRINVYKVIQWDKSNGAFVLDFIDFSLILLIIAFKRNPLLSLNDVYNRFQSWSISIYILFCNRYKVNKKKKKTSFLFAVETNKWRFHLLAALKSSLRRNQVLKIYCIFDARPCDADISAILLVKFERRSSLPPLSKTSRISPRPVRDPLLRLEINLLCIESPWFVISILLQHIREENSRRRRNTDTDWNLFELFFELLDGKNGWLTGDYFVILFLTFVTDTHERKM